VHKVIGDVLDPIALKKLKQHAINATYDKMWLDEQTCMHYAWPPKVINDQLNDKIRNTLGFNFRDIASFLRLNTSTIDTDFRIHNDAAIHGIKPTHAVVFYLEESMVSGTALFSHPEHGKQSNEVKVFTKDDGLWKSYYLYYARENSMLVYNANLFHGRFPWKAFGKNKYDGRIVLVKFLKRN
jgi:hypothetical protein